MRFNRLLEYRPLDRLEGMTDGDRADLLREVLRGGPSESAWRAMYELFALWPDNEAKIASLEAADRDLASWDDRLRAADTSSTALFDGPRLASLARIVRSISIYRRGDGGRSELLAVAASEGAARLTRLEIVRSEIGRSGWRTMVESPYLGSLEHLHVTNTVMAGDVFRRLLESKMPSLRCLKLTEVGIDAEYVREAPPPSPVFELRAIDFSRNVLGDEGARRLSRTPWLHFVEQLTLRHNFIREAGMRALLSSPFVPRLKQIDFSDNEASESERAALRRLADDRGVHVLI